MFIIIGLGNPGKEYALTRHNAGFFMLDKIREKWNFPEFEFNRKFQAEISAGNFAGNANLRSAGGEAEKIILVKPQTFMNLSVVAVEKLLDFYKLTLENILVIHDDLDIELGKYKLTGDPRSAGHNGVQNIIDSFGTQKFRRIRVGIGVGNVNLRSEIKPEDFVLEKFSPEELEILQKVSEEVLKEIEK